jgi:pre-mRNA-splicing factor CWC22
VLTPHRRRAARSHCFEDCFVRNFKLCHRLETAKIRNLAKLFAHLLGTDAISWAPLAEIVLSEASTTSASRIFIKYLFQELSEHLGLRAFAARLAAPDAAPHVAGLFPRDSMENMRFAINFYTAIGLGGLTDALRADLAKAKDEMAAVARQRQLAEMASSGSEGSSGSGSGSSSSSSSGSSGSGSSGSTTSSSGGASADSRGRRSPPRARQR